MATHSSVLAWRIPGTGEPGGLPCMGSHRVGNDCSDLAAAAAAADQNSPSLGSWEPYTLRLLGVCPGGSEVKASACNAGDLGSIPDLEDPWEKDMATHSSILAWRIPWMEKPGGLQSTGSQRVGVFVAKSEPQTSLSHFLGYEPRTGLSG